MGVASVIPIAFIAGKDSKMSIEAAYDDWASDYDTAANRTRDLEARALREKVAGLGGKRVLELGSGTGKNGHWLAGEAAEYTGLDFSEGMLEKARGKMGEGKWELKQADLTKAWPVLDGYYDWITCSLVLEHIEDLEHVFKEASFSLVEGGRFYIGEYHPMKQYLGRKARYEREGEIIEVDAYVHHVTDFTKAAERAGFKLLDIDEWFDEAGAKEVPRLLTLVFELSGP